MLSGPPAWMSAMAGRMDTVPSKSTSGISMEYVHTLSELSNEEIKSFVHGLSNFPVCICLVFYEGVSVCV